MATAPTHHADTKEAPDTKDTPKHEASHPPSPGLKSLDLLVALLATDWLRGDKRHYGALLSQTRRLLTELGTDGADALAELDGLRV
jgi:hypothetical protein